MFQDFTQNVDDHPYQDLPRSVYSGKPCVYKQAAVSYYAVIRARHVGLNLAFGFPPHLQRRFRSFPEL